MVVVWFSSQDGEEGKENKMMPMRRRRQSRLISKARPCKELRCGSAGQSRTVTESGGERAGGGGAPASRTDGRTEARPPPPCSRCEASQYAPVSAWQGLGRGERGAAAELHKTCREPAGAPIARPSPSGAPCWIGRGKREFFTKKNKKKKK